MHLTRSIVFANAFLLTTHLARSEPADVCLAMVNNASHDVGLQTSSASYLGVIYDNYCQQSGSTKDKATSFGISAVVASLPVSLTGGGTDKQTMYENFCKNYQSTFFQNGSSLDSRSIVVQKALDATNQCLAIATKNQSTVTYSIMTPTMLAIKFEVPSGQSLDLRKIFHESSVKCSGSRIGGGDAMNYEDTGQTISAAAGTYTVACNRSPFAAQNGTSIYNATGIVVDTNLGGLNIYWPPESVIPVTSASQLQNKLDALSENLERTQRALDMNILPEGSIIPWYEKDKEPPKGWVKCDGSHPSCPDLRNLFLLGGGSSEVGNAGGGSTISVRMSESDGAHPDGNGWSKDGHHFTSSYPITLPKPPYMTVLYIRKQTN